MSNHNANIIGVDVSGEHLDGHRLRDGESRRFANDGRGIRALVRWAGPEVVGVVYEATSSYHRDLEAAPFKAELPALRVNPGRARDRAQDPAHGRVVRVAKEPGPRGVLPAASVGREAQESGARGRGAQAGDPRQPAHRTGPPLATRETAASVGLAGIGRHRNRGDPRCAPGAPVAAARLPERGGRA